MHSTTHEPHISPTKPATQPPCFLLCFHRSLPLYLSALPSQYSGIPVLVPPATCSPSPAGPYWFPLPARFTVPLLPSPLLCSTLLHRLHFYERRHDTGGVRTGVLGLITGPGGRGRLTFLGVVVIIGTTGRDGPGKRGSSTTVASSSSSTSPPAAVSHAGPRPPRGQQSHHDRGQGREGRGTPDHRHSTLARVVAPHTTTNTLLLGSIHAADRGQASHSVFSRSSTPWPDRLHRDPRSVLSSRGRGTGGERFSSGGGGSELSRQQRHQVAEVFTSCGRTAGGTWGARHFTSHTAATLQVLASQAGLLKVCVRVWAAGRCAGHITTICPGVPASHGTATHDNNNPDTT
ncbi:hypothetical protein O3P69_001110 [Scylla paramamosain]|uniref:Uncharacterized protein n=1 Tax=Scylla paramamosain TaxID=85552 RepID=A0AAW0URY6_SCYPA